MKAQMPAAKGYRIRIEWNNKSIYIFAICLLLSI